ncbi:MAG: acetate--CoA ligase family protein [Rhizobiales bacterium]|nr:acetate--CoA ligase family protein [Hyphomicrobiales bacterium]
MISPLSRLLFPRSVVFIGGGECDVAIRKTRALGFTGKIYAVHPKRDQVGGVATIGSVNKIDEPIDAAFIAVKREPTIEIVRELSNMGCGGAVIYASGFAETGDMHLQDALLAAANGMPLMGPNCYGFVNGLARAALWPDEHGIAPVERGVAIITQSGNIACNFFHDARALPLAAVFAIGNQADVDMARMLKALAEDQRITAIGLHIEGLKDIPSFAKAASLARSLRKPVVALKTGRSEQGAKVAMSHTSSLAGADTLYDALFERYGIARMTSVTAFVETLKFLHHGGPLSDSRLVSMSCSGGEAALVADMALERKVSFPPFDAKGCEAVKATLNEYVSIDNPLDYHTFIWNQEDKLTATFSAVLRGGYDVAMLILDIPTHPRMSPATWLVTAKALVNAADATGARAAMVASLPECLPLDLAAELSSHGIAPMAGLDDALTAFEAAAFIGRNWAREEPPLIDAPPVVSRSVVRTLEEYEAKQLLAKFGLRVPRGSVCAAANAVETARATGIPVTLKTSSSEILHKTEAGGVALNLKTEEDVLAAAQRLSKLGPRLLVEEMVQGAIAELIIGLKSDPQFGMALVVGAGGILTELLKDSVTLLLPASRAEIERGVRRLKVWKLIEGFRGKPGNDQAVFDAIEAVARFAAAHAGLIEEADINPLLVTPIEAIAVDALLRMRTP